jgi:hypothetical protein
MSQGSRSKSILKLGSTTLFLFALLSPLTAARLVDAANIVTAEIDGELNICHQPDPCVAANFQGNATGSDVTYLGGVLLIYSIEPYAPQPCIGAVAGRVVVSDGAAAATFTGTLAPANSAAASCVGGLQGLSVTLSIDTTFGIVQLTTISPAGVTETLASGSGALEITTQMEPNT